jgi:hypothetical protein
VYRQRTEARRAAVARPYVPLLVATLAACDLPTELPKWNTTWLLPGESTTMGVGSILPAGITVTPEGGAFHLDLNPVTSSRSLGDMCPPCTAFGGLAVPKPAFTAAFESDIPLPERVISAALTGGQIRVLLRHEFSFDPLRPATGADGYLVITARSGQTVLAKDSIEGETTSLPANVDHVRTLSLSSATVTGPISIGIRLHTPAGNPVVVSTAQRLTVTATPAQVRVSRAQVSATNESVSTPAVELGLVDLDDEVADRLQAGAIRLTIENPFTVGGTLQLRIDRPGLPPLTRTAQVQPGSSSTRVAFAGEELRSLIGHPGVTFQALGNVSSPAGGTAVSPEYLIDIRTRWELTLGPRGD